MGDLLTPQSTSQTHNKAGDVFARLRNRLQDYRRRHEHSVGRYGPTAQGHYEQQRQDTALLQQRVLQQTKSKRKSSSKTKQSDNQGLGGRKRKHDSISDQSTVGDQYTFDGTSPNSKSQCTTGDSHDQQLHSSVSVNIVQQISNGNQSEQQIKLTVSSTVQSVNKEGDQQSKQGDCSTTTTTNVETNSICKQENPENHACANSQDPLGLVDLDPSALKAIIDNLEKEGIPADIIKDIDELKEAGIISDKTGNSLKNPMYTGGPVNNTSKSSSNPGMYADPLYDTQHTGIPTSANQGMGVAGQAPAVNYPRPPTAGGAAPPPNQGQILSDTGPAAETLKQMAAQHQHQYDGNPKSGYDFADYPGRVPPMYPHYGPNYGQNVGPRPAGGMYPYNQPSPNAMMGSPNMPTKPDPSMTYGQSKPDPSNMNYGQTKPLSHYPLDSGSAGSTGSNSSTPSSLQQLQNQVRTQFSQAPGSTASQQQHMHITQSQQMQMSGSGAPRMQMTQSQQMHIQGAPPPHQISVAQQQSFSMGNNPQQQQQQSQPQPGQVPPQGPTPQQQQYMNEQMKMRMYHQQKMQQQGMYMNQQGPADYKMGPGMNGAPGHPAYPNASGGPLQTMQNMVNQTNHPDMPPGGPQNGMYPRAMKQEAGGDYPGMRPPMMPPQHMANGSMPARPMKQENPGGYTSAIMRNQRPPNVNVGPEGLNISQQRQQDWPRPGMPPNMMPQQAMMRPGMPQGGQHMMQYRGYQQQAMMASGPRMQHMQGQAMGAMSGHPAMGHSGMMMSQQQAMHMQQHHGQMGPQMGHMNMPPQQQAGQGQAPQQQQPPQAASSHPNMPPQPGYPGASGNPGTNGPPQPGNYPSSGASNGQPDFNMDFLDNAQTNGSGDLFDSTSSDLLDDILFGSKS